jgi:hypothetical protein
MIAIFVRRSNGNEKFMIRNLTDTRSLKNKVGMRGLKTTPDKGNRQAIWSEEPDGVWTAALTEDVLRQGESDLPQSADQSL